MQTSHRPRFIGFFRPLASLVLVLALTACTTTTMEYRAKVISDNKAAGQLQYRKSYDSTGLALACWLTVWFYGGACWAYLGKPFEVDRQMLRNDARMELTPLVSGPFQFSEESFRRSSFRSEFTEKRYEPYTTAAAPIVPAKASISPEEFERSIIEKNTRSMVSPADRMRFPEGWPEKWFYETKDYKYWTIVGEPARDSAEAMISSKKKADQLITSEFPTLASKISYETTHNEVRNMNGKFESWRIIRVRQADVVK